MLHCHGVKSIMQEIKCGATRACVEELVCPWISDAQVKVWVMARNSSAKERRENSTSIIQPSLLTLRLSLPLQKPESYEMKMRQYKTQIL